MAHIHYDVHDRAPVVRTTSGLVEGRWQNACSAAYLGIPFAKAPVGALRFAAPEPYPAWEGIRQAVDYGPTPQRRPFGPAVTIPEPSIPGDETLNVNVFTPAPRNPTAKLPVFVWIHGGGYFAGSPSSPWYNGRSFNRDGVVTVSVSYRLGFQGFGGVEGAPLNRGLLDQIAALRWVRDNIAEFGGDPNKVTIGGQSAGGGSVLALLGSPKAAGLFRGVICESGCLNGVTPAQAETVGRALAKEVGVEPTLAGWESVPENAILDHERAVNEIADIPPAPTTAAELVGQVKQGFVGDSNLAYAPTIDGAVLPEPLDCAYAHGTGANVALLMGTVRNEFSYPVPTTETLDHAENTFRAAGLTEDAIARFANEVHRIGEPLIAGQLMTTSMFHLGLARTVSAREAGGSANRTWLYDFAQTSAVSNASMHCDEIPYAFDVLDDPKVLTVLGAEPSQSLADRIHGRWMEFISTGAITAPTVADEPMGAIQFLGTERYDAGAYRFARELAALAH